MVIYLNTFFLTVWGKSACCWGGIAESAANLDSWPRRPWRHLLPAACEDCFDEHHSDVQKALFKFFHVYFVLTFFLFCFFLQTLHTWNLRFNNFPISVFLMMHHSRVSPATLALNKQLRPTWNSPGQIKGCAGRITLRWCCSESWRADDKIPCLCWIKEPFKKKKKKRMTSTHSSKLAAASPWVVNRWKRETSGLALHSV